ncbi:uncharacterized protein EV422DRAFT_523945 [Fimicolochytrium jonesii]|uniref:uncharacterized protein n=1 Tax=Fimicolochytrium jonesii TaxID=1396493 RepID=UPI0022FE2B4B|nr:uncharacterized protein EV422DRAFT_523945 [Fimicolochytrium jonesii]KAI8822423.1 hypothetical protein EV422DRAFT_523945 [Fimicolochytrium jonesii]
MSLTKLSHTFDVVQKYQHDAAFMNVVAERPGITLKNIQGTGGFSSASEWGFQYCSALKAHAIVADDVWDVVPLEFRPTEEELEFARPFFELNRSEIREHDRQKQYSFAIRSLYRALSLVLAFSSAESVASQESQESTKQDKDETVVVNFLDRYLDFVIEPFEDAGALDGTPMRVELRPQPFVEGVWLRGVKVPCRTDGTVSVAIASGKKSTKTRTQPALLLECKRFVHKKTDANIVGQLAAELISMAQSGREQKVHADPERLESSFITAMHRSSPRRFLPVTSTNLTVEKKWLRAIFWQSKLPKLFIWDWARIG